MSEGISPSPLTHFPTHQAFIYSVTPSMRHWSWVHSHSSMTGVIELCVIEVIGHSTGCGSVYGHVVVMVMYGV